MTGYDVILDGSQAPSSCGTSCSAKAGTPATALDTSADVTFVPGTGITEIKLSVVGNVPGISAEDFEAAAQAAKAGCPVSQALSAVPITLDARLA